MQLDSSSKQLVDVKGISLQLRFDKINQMEKRKIMRTNITLMDVDMIML